MKKKTSSFRLRQLALLLLIAAVLAPSAVADQKLSPKQPYSLIFGTVFGPDNHPVPGVKVKIRRENEKKAVDLVSDSRGEFAHRFPAGAADYIVWADLKDRQAAQKTEVKVHVTNDERQDVTLHLTNQSSK
jgi:hypothetical protein